MTLLFLDTETSGLLNKKAPLDDPSQPWAVSIAAQLCDEQGNHIACLDTRVRSEGRKVSEGALAVHGLSSRVMGMTGVKEPAALGVLLGLADQALAIIGHGVDFDVRVISGVLVRRNIDPSDRWTRSGVAIIDTMKASTALCNIQREDGSQKWPSLDEAGELLLSIPRRTGVHAAWDDMQRSKRLYFELVRRGVIESRDGRPYVVESDDLVRVKAPSLVME